MITYKMKQVSLKPDVNRNNIIVKMITKYKDGKFVKHIKLDEDAIKILTFGTIIKEKEK